MIVPHLLSMPTSHRVLDSCLWGKVQLISFFSGLIMGQKPSFRSPRALGCLPGLLVLFCPIAVQHIQ